MKKILLILIILFSFGSSYAQKMQYGFSLSDSIRKFFNYDTLKGFSCKQTPAGIYLIRFKINSQNTVYDYKFSDDSLILLAHLFKSALNLSLKKNHVLTLDKEYLQLIYYNNYSWCNYQHDTTIKTTISIDKEVLKLLSDQITAIENSINRISLDERLEFIVLNPVVINNIDPKRPVSKGFNNDYRKGDIRELSEDKLEKLVEEVKRRRDAKAKSGN